MTIILNGPERRQRGKWGWPTTVAFRGQWQPSTVYQRGDIIMDPCGVLCWSVTQHTSPAVYSPGTQFSAQGVLWLRLPTNGTFRGVFQASHGATATTYGPNDLVIDPTTNELKRALYADSAPSGVYNAARHAPLGIVPVVAPIDQSLILPPTGTPNAPLPHGLGLFNRKTRIQYPRVRPLAVLRTSADFTSIVSGTVTADADPIDGGGCPLLSFNVSNGAKYTKQLAATVDISNSIVRFPIKLTGDSAVVVVTQIATVGTLMSTGAPVTSIPLDSTGLWRGLGPGMLIKLDDGAGHTQVFTVSDYVSAASGLSVLSIPVVSQTPTFAFPAATTTVGLVGRSGLSHIYFQVSSDNFATQASSYDLLQYGNGAYANSCWTFTGLGPMHWVTAPGFASPATLTAVNSFRLILIASNTNNTMSVSRLDVLPNNGAAGSKGDGRAKCILWFDDSYAAHWSIVSTTLIPYGFPATLAAGGKIDPTSVSTLTYPQHQHLAHMHGWQFAMHYYWAGDGGDPGTTDGLAKEASLNRIRHSLLGAGTSGQDDFAWHDSDTATSANLPVMRKHTRAIRGYGAGTPLVSTLPPVSTDYVSSYGIGGADVTGGTVATTTAALNSGTAYTSVPITALTQDVAATETVTIGGVVFTVSANTSAAAVSLPVVSLTPGSTINSGTSVLNPGSVAKGIIDSAITYAGMAMLTWENVDASHAELFNIAAYLDWKRSSIDVVTFAEALQPWTVTV